MTLNMPMIPGHPKWEEFSKRLEGPDGCNFHYKEGLPRIPQNIAWDCGGGEFRLARFLLKQYPDVEVEASIAYYKAHGGHCDCEVVFNV